MNFIDHVISLALDEDIGLGDITTDNLITGDLIGNGIMVAKESFIIAGLEVVEKVFKKLASDIIVKPNCKDGDNIKNGDIILNVNGKLKTLLTGERTALNFLQHLSGIATNTNSYVKALASNNTRIVDTRKTTPGLRSLEKYAVMVGGAYNHRMGLYDGVLIKDNHIAVSGGILKAVNKIKNKVSHLVKIEVETSNLTQVKEAIEACADVIMLDNMDNQQIKESVKLINKKAIIEVSGGITKLRLKELSNLGIDIISVGALTHSARSVDISMKIEVRS